MSRPKPVEGVLSLLSADQAAARKTREQMVRARARAGREEVAVRGGKLRNSQGSEPCPLSAMKDFQELIREADR